MALIRFSGVLAIPVLKQNCPNGVMEVVRSFELGGRGIYQSSQFATSLLEAPVSSATVLSTFGRGLTLCTLSFMCL